MSHDSTHNSWNYINLILWFKIGISILCFWQILPNQSINQITKWPPPRPHLSKYQTWMSDATESDEQMFICMYYESDVIIWNFYYVLDVFIFHIVLKRNIKKYFLWCKSKPLSFHHHQMHTYLISNQILEYKNDVK